MAPHVAVLERELTRVAEGAVRCPGRRRGDGRRDQDDQMPPANAHLVAPAPGQNCQPPGRERQTTYDRGDVALAQVSQALCDPCQRHRAFRPRANRAHEKIDSELDPEEQGDVNVVGKQVSLHQQRDGGIDRLEGRGEAAGAAIEQIAADLESQEDRAR